MAFPSPEEKKKKLEKKPAERDKSDSGQPREAANPGAPAGPPAAGMPKPGQSIDPMMAMFGGLGPQPAGPSWMPPGGLGAGGGMELPPGGQLPPPGAPGGDNMGGSPLLQAMRAAVSDNDADDMYGPTPPGMEHGPQVGQGDPNMGIQQLLALIAMAQMGVGGAPGAGSSGVGFDSNPSMGMMNGFGG